MVNHRAWIELTTEDIAALDGQRCVAVLPVGAVEQHGPHLPLGTDSYIAEGIVERALSLLDDTVEVVTLPLQQIGHSPEHGDFHGTLGQEAEILLAAWTKIGADLCHSGVRKLVIFNAHGGQPQVVDLVAQRLRSRHAMLVVRANYMAWPLPDGLIDPDEQAHGHHGGTLETSIMLALRPDLVRMDKAAGFASAARDLASRHRRFGHGGRLGFAWQAQDLNAAGVVGNAAAAEAETGRRLIEHHAARLAELITDAAAFDLTNLHSGPL
jgi:creatinine amidohydrolase